jgi:hypothetical protein
MAKILSFVCKLSIGRETAIKQSLSNDWKNKILKSLKRKEKNRYSYIDTSNNKHFIENPMNLN